MSKDSGSRTLGFPASPRNLAIGEWFETASAGRDPLRTLADCIDIPFGNSGLGGQTLEKGRGNPFSEVRIGDHVIDRPSAIVELDGPAFTSESIWRAMLDGEPANGIFAEISENRDRLVLVRLADGWPGEEIVFTRTGHVMLHHYHIAAQRLITYKWRHVDVPSSFEVANEQVNLRLIFREDGTMAVCRMEGPEAIDCLEGRGAPLVYGSPTSWFDLSEVSLRGVALITGAARLEDRISSLSHNAELTSLEYLEITVNESVNASLLGNLLHKASLEELRLEGDRDLCEFLRGALQDQTGTKISFI